MKSHLYKIGACLLLLLSLTANNASAATGEDARQFIDNVGKLVLETVNGGGAEEAKRQKLRQMFTQHIDIDWMGKFVLGAGWNQASEDQRTRYMQVYREYLLARYTTNFADYTGSNYNITGVKSESDGQFTVSMEVKSPKANQQSTQAGYRVRADNGQFKIIDIIVEGVSLITTQRSEFASVLQQKNMDGLISAIEAKKGGG